MTTPDTDKQIQHLVAQLLLTVPGEAPERIVVAEGVLATILAGVAVEHRMDVEDLVATALGQVREMMDTALAIHSLN